MQQIVDFILELEKLKGVTRKTRPLGLERYENSAEHSWQLALLAASMVQYAAAPVDLDRVIRMLLIHDLVEIDVGDVPIHSANGQAHGSPEVLAAERRAADRIFGLLPDDLGPAFRALWEEFEAAATPDAIFAKSLDRVQPVMQNLASGGGTWIEYAVTFDQLESRVGARVARGAPALWAWVRERAKAYFEG